MSTAPTTESAIPAHLRTERTRHRRIPDDFAPPYPSFVARSSTAVRQVVMAYLGLQCPGPVPAGALDVLDAAWPTQDGPGHHDRAQRSLPGGGVEIVSVAYWDDPAAFDRWFAAHRDSWLGDDVRDGLGRWVEVLRPTVEEHETLFSSLGRPEGVARLGTMGPAARLRLYHEVSVVAADEQYFEYVDCRPGTGLSGV